MNSIIYARQSLDRDGQGLAVERQITECRDLANALGLTIAREFVDNDVSATTGVRPAFTELLKSIKAGQVSEIVVWHTDRLYRKMRDLLEVLELAQTHKIKILTVRAGELDLSTPAGQMMAQMMASVAGYEVAQKGARQVASNIQRAKKGEWQFSIRPYGYERRNGEVVIVPEEAAILREAVTRYLAGESYFGIAQSLNERGVKTLKGKTWTGGTLKSRLSNPANAGFRVYKGERVATGNWEPIFDLETWERFEASSKRRASRHDWSNNTKHLLSGLALCGVCGGTLFARPQRNKLSGNRFVTQQAYACTAKWCVSRDLIKVNAVVESAMIQLLSQPDRIELIKPKEDLSPLMARATDLRARKDDLAQLLSEGVLTLGAVREASQKLSKELESLQDQINIQAGNSTLSSLLMVEDVSTHWHEKLSLEQKREIIRFLFRVEIYKQANNRVFDQEAIKVSPVTA